MRAYCGCGKGDNDDDCKYDLTTIVKKMIVMTVVHIGDDGYKDLG